MIAQLLAHQWKAYRRSPIWNKNLVINLVLGFFGLYMAVVIGMLGFLFGFLGTRADADLAAILGQALLYYWLVDFGLRELFFNTSGLHTLPYLHLPLSRAAMARYVLVKDQFGLFTQLFLLLAAGMVFGCVEGGGFTLPSGIMLAVLACLVLGNTWLVGYLKRRYRSKPLVGQVLLVLVGLVVYAAIEGWIPLDKLGSAVIVPLLDYPLLAILFLAYPVLGFVLGHRYIVATLYPLQEPPKTKVAEPLNIPFLHRLGRAGQFIDLELKLILRHKRTKGVLYVSLGFYFYGLIFILNPAFGGTSIWLGLFLGTMLTGMFTLNYGQFSPSWEASHWDNLLTSPTSWRQWLLAKWYLFVFSCLISIVFTAGYAYFDMQYLYTFAACGVYNAGVNSLVVLAMGAYNHKRIDLSRSSMMNWQGVGGSQFLLMVPTLVLPMIIILPFWAFQAENNGLVALTATGLIAMLTRNYWLGMIESLYQEKKYLMAAGFRTV